MKHRVYAIRDKAVGEFMQPFFCRARGEAIRTFQDACNDPKSPFFMHAKDFSLYEIGLFESDDGILISAGAEPEFVVSAETVLLKEVPTK